MVYKVGVNCVTLAEKFNQLQEFFPLFMGKNQCFLKISLKFVLLYIEKLKFLGVLMIEQKNYIINLTHIMDLTDLENKNRYLANLVNKEFDTDYWDSERVRDVFQKYNKKQNRKIFNNIKIPKVEQPQNLILKNKKIMVTADWHFPFHREDLIENITKHKDEICALIVGGDAFNNDSLSRFLSIGKQTFEEEIIEFYNFVKLIRDILPSHVKMIFIRGNHCLRLFKAIAAMQEKGLQKFINPEVLAMLSDGFTIYENGKKIDYLPINNLTYIRHWFCNINNELIICHPEENSKTQVKTAVNAVDYFLKRNEQFEVAVTAHTHKYGSTTEYNKWAIQIGCCCKPQKYSDTGKFGYTPQDYNYIIFEFDENGKINKNQSKIYMLDEMYPITEDINYNIII
jgi:predicted phosphodiesterase